MQNLSILNQEIKISDNLFCLNDLHRASGGEKKHTPSRFIRLEQTKELVKEIEQNPDMGLAVETRHGGKASGTFVCKELVYAYAMWISAKFSLLVIRTFDQLQNQQAEPQAKLESPYIEGKYLAHIKTGVKRIVHKTGKSYQTVYGGLNHFFGAPNINEIEKGYYGRVCAYLDIPTDFEVPADTMTQQLLELKSESRIKGLNLMLKAGLAKTEQDRKIAIAESHIKCALAEIEAAKQYSGTIYDGIYEAKHQLKFSNEEITTATKRAKKGFVKKFPLLDDETKHALGIEK